MLTYRIDIAAPSGFITPGAVFKTSDVKPYYGRLVENISYSEADVVQYGFGFAVPVTG